MFPAYASRSLRQAGYARRRSVNRRSSPLPAEPIAQIVPRRRQCSASTPTRQLPGEQSPSAMTGARREARRGQRVAAAFEAERDGPTPPSDHFRQGPQAILANLLIGYDLVGGSTTTEGRVEIFDVAIGLAHGAVFRPEKSVSAMKPR